MKRVGYWMNEKKRNKLKFDDFVRLSRDAGIDVSLIDLDINLEEQGPYDLILHKLNDVLAKADTGDDRARNRIQNVQSYLMSNPRTIAIDPLENVQRLLSRNNHYRLIEECHAQEEGLSVVVPAYVELDTNDISTNRQLMQASGLTFPCICKPLVAQGPSSHKMSIIFNDMGLKDIQTPCVVQSFINHNAVLQKVFIIGDLIHIVQRPSLKNFLNTDKDTIFFNSHDVSKPYSACFLNELDDVIQPKMAVCEDEIRRICRHVQTHLGLELIGVDIVQDMTTGKYAIIDINIFPDFDEVPNFNHELLKFLQLKLQSSKTALPSMGESEFSMKHMIGGVKCLSKNTIEDSDLTSDNTKDGATCLIIGGTRSIIKASKSSISSPKDASPPKRTINGIVNNIGIHSNDELFHTLKQDLTQQSDLVQKLSCSGSKSETFNES